MSRAVTGFLAVLFLVLLSGTAKAQYVFPKATPTPSPSPTATPSPTPPPCPTVKVHTQAGRRIRDGERARFTANIVGGDQKVIPTIVWSTSAGVITGGNGTRQIEVDTTGAGNTPDREVRAEVWIGGFAPQCTLQASATVSVLPTATKFGEFGEVDDQTLKRNLDHLAKYLSQSQDNLALIAYAGRSSERGYALNWIKRIKDALVVGGLAERRIVAMDGGFRETPLFDFWIVPRGADLPSPSPTIRRSEIVGPRTRPPRKPS
jgi:hypothetical protein